MQAKTNPRVAVIGCGYWGKNLVRNFAELGALAAVCDEDPGRAAEHAAKFSVPALTLDDILASPDITGVAIATLAESHARLAAAALQAGKHVFVEKPIALRLEDAERLQELAAQTRKVLMVGHLLQYHPAFIRLEELVRSGQVGRLQHIYSHRLNLGKVRREENILWSFAPHDISMILSLVGTEPVRVSAMGSCFLDARIADVTTTHLEFPEGERAHVFVSWLHPYKEQKLVVVADRCMAVFDDTEPWERKLALYPHKIEWKDGAPVPNKAEVQWVELSQAEPLREEARHFLDCCAGNARCRTDSAEAIRVLKVLQASELALRENRPVKLSSFGDRPEKARSYSAHPTACIDPGCSIGAGTRIWHFSHILPGSAIGRDCVIGQNVMIGPDVKIGDRCKIQNNVSVYKGVTLEDGVFCGPSCVFTNVKNPRAEIDRRDEFLRTLVRRGVTIGANATVVCGVELGEYSFIGAGSVVTKDVPPFALVTGNPARQSGWVSHAGEVLKDDLVCRRTGRRYRLEGGNRLLEILEKQASG